MIFELMSRGNIVELPNEYSSDEDVPNVTLLLPYGRLLKGSVRDGGESWLFCKAGEEAGEEIFLYDGQPKTFNFDKGHRVSISSDVVHQLKKNLMANVPPPGEHRNAAAILRSISSDPDILNDGKFISDEESALKKLKNNPEAAAAYWGIRFALSKREHDVISRIKLWYRIAPHIAFDDSNVRVWFSLTQIPDNDILDAMTALGFPRDDIQRIAAQGTSPVVLFSRGGYLLLALYGDGSNVPLFREWAYFPAPVWNELRERRRVTLRELLVLAWGAKDARDALERSSFYADC